MQDRAFEIMAKNEQIGNRIELESQLLELTLSLTTDWRKEHTNVPVFLYHYTNAAGLNGIISSNRMWATNISYLNDSSEILYASELIKQTLEESEHKNDLNIVKEFLIRAQRTFNSFDSPRYVLTYENRAIRDIAAAATRFGATFFHGVK